MTVGSAEAAAGEPKPQHSPTRGTPPAGERAGSSSPAGEPLPGCDGGASPGSGPAPAEGSGSEAVFAEIPQLVAEAPLNVDAHASAPGAAGPESAAQGPGDESREKQPSHRRRPGEQHVGRTARTDLGMARAGGHGQNSGHFQEKTYKNHDGRPCAGALARELSSRGARPGQTAVPVVL